MSGDSDPTAAEPPVPELPPTLVIDVGTSAARAVLVTDSASWLVPDPETGSANWPAAAYWDGDRLLVGAAAEQRRGRQPDNYWADFKRGLTVDASVAHGDRRFRPIDHVSALLSAVREVAQHRLGGPIERALLTVPADYRPGDRRRRRLIEAAEQAGLGLVELLPEPVAAAYAATFAPDALVLVFDLGAGSLDLALLRAGDEAQLIGADTREDTSGGEIDAQLAGRIHADGAAWLAPLLAAVAANPGSPESVRLGIDFADFTRRIKHGLSDAPTVVDALRPGLPAYQLTRADLDHTADRLLSGAVDACEQLLRRHRVKPDDLDAVLLTGGGVRMPAVAQRLAHSFGRTPYLFADPELTVVYGASRWLSRSDRHTVQAEPLPAGVRPLRFPLPGGSAELTRWLVTPDARYPAGAALARVRLAGGALWDLTADEPGTVHQLLAVPGSTVAADQWLLLSRP